MAGYVWTIALIVHDLLKMLRLIPDVLFDRWGY